MLLNADKPHLWKKDIASSVDQFNTWFMEFAPKAYRNTRLETTDQVENCLRLTNDLKTIGPSVLESHPEILSTLRMATCPPLARDRLIGLARVNKNLVESMEKGSLPPRMSVTDLKENLGKISNTILRMLDEDIFPWLDNKKGPLEEERHRASTIVADRLCGATSDPIIRNAQEKRQLASISRYLKRKGYRQKAPTQGIPITEMQPGTFSFRTNIIAGEPHQIKIPVDVLVQPKIRQLPSVPILIEAKSAGDFTNVNKRRKEEATKVSQLRRSYGDSVQFVLFLCGYFDSGYLGYEAAEGIDWVWEHRIADLDRLGI